MPDHSPTLHAKRSSPPKGGSIDIRPCGSRWRKLRLSILAQHPVCVYCAAYGFVTASKIVDHIIALSLGGSSETENLTGCCRKCNDEKGILEQAWLYDLIALETAAPVRDTLPWFIKIARATK
jgi:hypothetical protein